MAGLVPRYDRRVNGSKPEDIDSELRAELGRVNPKGASVADAWDVVKDVASPEAEALRALFGSASFRVLINAHVPPPHSDRDRDVARLLQAFVAECYLFAVRTERK